MMPPSAYWRQAEVPKRVYLRPVLAGHRRPIADPTLVNEHTP